MDKKIIDARNQVNSEIDKKRFYEFPYIENYSEQKVKNIAKVFNQLCNNTHIILFTSFKINKYLSHKDKTP